MVMQDPKDLFLHPTSDLGKDLFSTSVAELRRKVRIFLSDLEIS